MFRSLLVRLLGFAAAVAFLTASGTFWLTDADAPDGPVPAADEEIRAELYRHARAHPDWSGVAPLVADLAERTGRRIVLTAANGDVIADSARLLGRTVSGLPTGQSTVVDAAAPFVTTPRVRSRTGDVGLAYRGFRLSDEEQRERDAMVDAAIDCLRGDPDVRDTETRSFTATGLFGGDDPVPAVRSCVPKGLSAPSDANLALNGRAVTATADCLDGHGLTYEIAVDARGLDRLLPAVGTGTSPQWTECVEQAKTTAASGRLAPAAGLHLGDGRSPSDEPDWWPAALVLAAVLASTVVFADRLARPMAAFAASVGGRERRRRELMSDVAHELRAPLTTVRAYLEAAEAEVLPLDLAFVRSLHEEAGVLERLVSDMDDLGLAEAGVLRLRPEFFDAADLAAELVAAHQAAAPVRLDAPEPVAVRADRARLRQVLANLVSNAVRHTPADGTVTVAVRADGDQAVLTVADTGSGIGEEDLPHIFERFHRNGSDGKGLGLAIAARIVEAHRGDIAVTSEVGAGTTVTVRLPLALTTS